MEYKRNFKWPSFYRVACLKPSFIHRIWSKKCASHFCRETTNKNNQFSKWETWMFKAILDQIKCCEWELYFNSFLNLSVWVSAMQCNRRKGNASRCNIKKVPHSGGGMHREGQGARPPLVRPCTCPRKNSPRLTS